jgi:hypothetical protein
MVPIAATREASGKIRITSDRSLNKVQHATTLMRHTATGAGALSTAKAPETAPAASEELKIGVFGVEAERVGTDDDMATRLSGALVDSMEIFISSSSAISGTSS